MWGSESTPPISLPILSLPTTEGGMKLLNLKAQNKAIQLTWLKTYLQMDTTRPTWTFIADELINKTFLSTNTDRLTKINIFMQSWGKTPNTRSKLPRDLMEMIRVGREYNTQLQTLLPSHTLKEQLPAWYHIGASHRLIELTNKPEAKCLRHLHKVQSVRDVKTIASTNCRGHKPEKKLQGYPVYYY